MGGRAGSARKMLHHQWAALRVWALHAGRGLHGWERPPAGATGRRRSSQCAWWAARGSAAWRATPAAQWCWPAKRRHAGCDPAGRLPWSSAVALLRGRQAPFDTPPRRLVGVDGFDPTKPAQQGGDLGPGHGERHVAEADLQAKGFGGRAAPQAGLVEWHGHRERVNSQAWWAAVWVKSAAGPLGCYGAALEMHATMRAHSHWLLQRPWGHAVGTASSPGCRVCAPAPNSPRSPGRGGRCSRGPWDFTCVDAHPIQRGRVMRARSRLVRGRGSAAFTLARQQAVQGWAAGREAQSMDGAAPAARS
jgi:hypothetical protein